MPELPSAQGRSRRKSRNRSPAQKWVGRLELLGGVLICLLTAATPWLFGTTEAWSVALMNYGSYAAGAIMLAAALLNRLTRLEDPPETSRADRLAKYAFLAVNLLLLAFCLVAYFNARATFSIEDRTFDYREYISWLPTTYDAGLTLDLFFTLLACFAAFWSGRYWLMRGWDRALNSRSGGALATALSNHRLVAFLWVICLNGLLLSAQGILQRLSGTPELLWLRMSYAEVSISCFGPFSYRGNAAEFLNLIWPAALGFWWALSRERRRTEAAGRLLTDGPEMMLIPAAVVILAGTIVSASRGGVAVGIALLFAVGVLFAFQRRVSKMTRVSGLILLAAVLGFLTFTGWEDLARRLKEDPIQDMNGRVEIYENARQIAADFPIYGTGPGSFRSVYHLYREDATQVWHGFLHDDWLETRVTFGWVGFALVLLQLALLAAWAAAKGRGPAHYVTSVCLGLSLAGCLAHAKYDFPLQTYSILYTFVMLAAILTTISPERR